LFKDHIENNVFHFYPSCQILFEEYGISGNFQKHLFLLESLADKLIRFNDFETLRKDLILFENPFTVQTEEQNLSRFCLDLQAELCDLQCDISLKI